MDPNVGELTPDQPRRPTTDSTLKVCSLWCPVQGSELCEAQRVINSNDNDNRDYIDATVPSWAPGAGLGPSSSPPLGCSSDNFRRSVL